MVRVRVRYPPYGFAGPASALAGVHVAPRGAGPRQPRDAALPPSCRMRSPRSRGVWSEANAAFVPCFLRACARLGPAPQRARADAAPTARPRARQDPRVERLPCTHAGTYADDCICERVRQHKCYIVATCDRDLRRRLRKARAPVPWRLYSKLSPRAQAPARG